MAQRVVQNVENDYLMCSICLCRYDEPRLLPCGHTFCARCLSEHIQQSVLDRNSRHFTCPIDRSQIAKPRTNRHPREWANLFPIDTFTISLLQAVVQHESGEIPENIAIPITNRRPPPSEPVDEYPVGFVNTEGLTCVEHTGRQLEFFCLGCSELVCAHCAVRSHRRQRCECIAFQEAMTRLRPRIEALRRKFQNQMHRIEQLSRGEVPLDSVLENSKALAMQSLDEIEDKLSRFSQICLQSVEDLRQQVRNAGNDLIVENQQLSFIFDNIQETKLTFDNIMNTNSAPDILNLLPKMESQADEYETAMRATTANVPSKIEITTNTAFENFLRNPPPAGVLKVIRAPRPNDDSSIRENTFNVANPSVSGPRRAPPGARRRPTAAVRPTVTPRNPMRPPQQVRRQGPGQKSKSSINVKNTAEDAMTWQLTGIAFVGYTVVMADSYNHLLRRCSIAGSASVNQTMHLEAPLDITNLTAHNELAVTQPEKRQIAIIEVDDDALRVKEIVRTHKQYEGICLLGGNNFVVSTTQGRSSIDIIDRIGRVQSSIERSQLFRCPRFLTVIPSGSIVVSDRDQRTITCMTQTGQVEWTYGAPSSTWGVASDGGGKIFLCLENNCVQMLSNDGTIVQEKFITARDAIRIPYAVCARSGQIAITEYGSSLFAPNSPWVHVVSF